MRARRNLLRSVSTWLLMLGATTAGQAMQEGATPPRAGGVLAAAPTTRAVRSVSGTKGSIRDGRYVVEDARTIFYVPEDKQVTVYFEWEGKLGTHRLEGLWKAPDGKTSSVQEFTYEAKQKRFGGYWTLMLVDTMQTGTWILEARVDGETAGSHEIQVQAASRPVDLAKPVRILRSRSEVYQIALGSTVTVENFGANGAELGSGIGFLSDAGGIATAFQVIDGATSLRVTFPDGRTRDVDEILRWNRREDWALLHVADTTGVPALVTAPDGSWDVGDRCYAIDSSEGGSRILLQVDIIGRNTFPGAGDRINLSSSASLSGTGGPILNDYGEVVAISGGSLLPGVGSLRGVSMGWSSVMMDLTNGRGGLAVPITLLSRSSSRPATLTQLAAAGQLTPPLVGYEHVEHGMLGRAIDENQPAEWPSEDRSVFSRKDAEFYVVLGWRPKEKKKGQVVLRVFDLDNHPVMQSRAFPINLRRDEWVRSTWKLPLTNVPAAVYRLDVVLNEDAVWRTYFRVRE